MNELRPLTLGVMPAEHGPRPDENLWAFQRAVADAKGPRAKYEALMERARAEARHASLQKALDTYWEARHVTRRHRLGRTGDADLAIGQTMLDQGRTGEGLEAVRRAVRYYRRLGNTFMRGCAETVLAEHALAQGDDSTASRHLDLAEDLILASGDPRMLSSVATLKAEVAVHEGRAGDVETLLELAGRIARDVADPEVAFLLQAQRTAVWAHLRGPDIQPSRQASA